MFEKLKNHNEAMVDLGVVLMIGIAFVGLVVVSYIIFKVKDSLFTTSTTTGIATAKNITSNWDSQVSLIMVAITIFILSLAIASLLYLRGGNQ